MTPAQKKKGWIKWPCLQIRIPLEFQRLASQLAAWGEIACTYCSYTERFLGCWQIWNSTWIWQTEGIWRADMRQTPMSGTHRHHSSLSSFKFVPSGIILWCMHLFCVEAPSSTLLDFQIPHEIHSFSVQAYLYIGFKEYVCSWKKKISAAVLRWALLYSLTEGREDL